MNKPIKIAYIFSVYKDFEYLARILKMLDAPWADFYVHVDRKSKLNIKKFKEKYNLERVNFLKNRMAVNWGGFSQVKSTIRLLEAVRNSGIKYDRIIFMTDGEIPYWSNERIYRFFSDEKNLDKEFMSATMYPEPHTGNENPYMRAKYYTFFDFPLTRFFKRKTITKIMWFFVYLQGLYQIERKLLPMKYYNGSSKFYITYDFMVYLLDYFKLNPQDFNSFKYTNCIDEVFFQTFLLNSKFKKNHVNNLFKFHVWDKNNPFELNLTYVKDIEQKEPFIVAKLNQGFSDELFDYIEKHRID